MNELWKRATAALSSALNGGPILAVTLALTVTPAKFAKPVYAAPVGDAAIIPGTSDSIENATACIAKELAVDKSSVTMERPSPYPQLNLTTSRATAFVSLDSDRQIILDATANEVWFYSPGIWADSRVSVAATRLDRRGGNVGIVHAVRYKDEDSSHAEAYVMHGVPADAALTEGPLPHSSIDLFVDASAAMPNAPLLHAAAQCLLIKQHL